MASARDSLERAVRAVADQATAADALVREAVAADLDGSHQGNRAGFYQITCTQHIPFVVGQDVFRVSELCEGTIWLENGTVELAGQLTFLASREPRRIVASPFTRGDTEGFHFAITGGTDAYEDAGGEVRPGRQGAITLNLVP